MTHDQLLKMVRHELAKFDGLELRLDEEGQLPRASSTEFQVRFYNRAKDYCGVAEFDLNEPYARARTHIRMALRLAQRAGV